jgi:hypothetical protein
MAQNRPSLGTTKYACTADHQVPLRNLLDGQYEFVEDGFWYYDHGHSCKTEPGGQSCLVEVGQSRCDGRVCYVWHALLARITMV